MYVFVLLYTEYCIGLVGRWNIVGSQCSRNAVAGISLFHQIPQRTKPKQRFWFSFIWFQNKVYNFFLKSHHLQFIHFFSASTSAVLKTDFQAFISLLLWPVEKCPILDFDTVASWKVFANQFFDISFKFLAGFPEKKRSPLTLSLKRWSFLFKELWLGVH